MRPNRYVIFQDHFTGEQPSIERYNIDDTYGSALHTIDGFTAEGGALAIMSERYQADYCRLSTIDPEQFALSKESILDARFRLLSDDACRFRIGFYQSPTNYISLDFDSDLANGGVALHADQSTIHTYDYAPIVMDAGWHTIQLRLLGTGNGAECVIDGDETNKVELANGVLPTTDQYGAFIYAETRGSSGLGAGDERGAFVSHWRVTQLR